MLAKRIAASTLLSILILSCAGNKTPVITLQLTGTSCSFRAVHAVSESCVWASGSDGIVLRTIDSGETWTQASIPLNKALSLRGLHAFGTDTCVVLSVGSPGYIFKTCDSGHTWKAVYENTDPHVFLNSMTFWDKKHGIAVGDPMGGGFTVLTTSDGGDSWNRVPAETLPAPADGEMQFAASNTCVSVRGTDKAWFGTGVSAARIFYTGDRGRTWQAFDTPLTFGNPSSGIFSVAFYDTLSGIVCGGDYLQPSMQKKAVAATNDGGRTWNLLEQFPSIGFCSCAAFIPGARGKGMGIAGTNGIVLTADSGESWRKLSAAECNVIGFSPGGRFGWAGGTEGTIYRIAL